MALAQAQEAETSMTQLGQEVLEKRLQAKQSQAQKASDSAEHAAQLKALQAQVDAAGHMMRCCCLLGGCASNASCGLLCYGAWSPY